MTLKICLAQISDRNLIWNLLDQNDQYPEQDRTWQYLNSVPKLIVFGTNNKPSQAICWCQSDVFYCSHECSLLTHLIPSVSFPLCPPENIRKSQVAWNGLIKCYIVGFTLIFACREEKKVTRPILQITFLSNFFNYNQCNINHLWAILQKNIMKVYYILI